MRRSSGQALVQVLIACIVLATAASGVAFLLLGTYGQTGGRLLRKEQATATANEILQALKNYVTADAANATSQYAPQGCWDFIGPSGCPANSWALSTGNHDVSFLMPASLQPFQTPCPGAAGSLIYTVVRPSGSNFAGPANVSVQICWQEPS